MVTSFTLDNSVPNETVRNVFESCPSTKEPEIRDCLPPKPSPNTPEMWNTELVTSSSSNSLDHSTTRQGEIETLLDTRLATCLYFSCIKCEVTDEKLFTLFSSHHARDAFVIQDHELYEPSPINKNEVTESVNSSCKYPHHLGLVLFPDSVRAMNAIKRVSLPEFQSLCDGKSTTFQVRWKLARAPPISMLRTPLGCMHRGCRTLLSIMLHFSLHSTAETAEAISRLEEIQHAGVILCHPQFISSSLAPAIVRSQAELKPCISSQILSTLLSEESSDDFITDSMRLWATLFQRRYFSVTPVYLVYSIVSQEVRLTRKILRGLCVLLHQTQEMLEGVNIQGILAKIYSRNVEAEGKEVLVELTKLLCFSSRGNGLSEAPNDLIPYLPQRDKPSASTLYRAGSDEGRLSKEEYIHPYPQRKSGMFLMDNQVTDVFSSSETVLLPPSIKQNCSVCSSRARIRCMECEKKFCFECQKHDSQIHDCLSRTVYVSKVDPSVTAPEFREILDQYGTVSKVRLCGDPNQRSLYAFIEFTTIAAAKKLLQSDKQTVLNFTWRCLPARQPIHDHNEEDQVHGLRPRPCLFGSMSTRNGGT